MDFLPPRLSDLRDWAANFSSLISSAPASYGLTAGDAAGLAAAVGAFAAAHTLGVDPSTRTRSTVAATRAARAAMTVVVRRFAGIIRANPGVGPAQLTALGLTVRGSAPAPIPAPATFPLIGVLGATPGRHALRFADSASPDSRAKPAGAAALQLFRAVGDGEAATPEEARLIGQYTTNPLRIDTPRAQAGKTATYFGRWVTQRGLTGPWSAGVSFTVAA